ncbi:MAG TPA: hypothetical protein VGC78_13335 [Gaiellaceae bacterium]|jgi:hypothetical protein
MLRLVLAAVVAAATVVAPALAAAHPHLVPHTTARQAERNLLRAQRMLGRWHAGLTIPRTGLLRPNTSAQCRGVGRGVARHTGSARAFFAFRCVIRNRRRSVAVVYHALPGNGFEVRHRVLLRH